MKYDDKNKNLKEELKKILEENPDKAEAILEAVEKFNSAANQELIDKIQKDARRAEHDSEYREKLGLRTLSEKEKGFYEFLKNSKQVITAEQVDIIPEETIDYTLANVKKKSRIGELISFAPANVKKWMIASKTGKASWGKLTGEIVEMLSGKFESLLIELGKLSVALVIPKAIRDLSYEFVDIYFTACLEEVMNDGIEEGYLMGTGVDQPIGIFNKIDDFNSDKTAKEKAISTSVKGFSPKQLATVKKFLSNNGMRPVPYLALICNPEDCYEFVEPSLYGEGPSGDYVQKSKTRIEIYETTNCPKGKAIFTLPKMYVMGFSGLQVHEYKETKALEDADLLIAKVYGNGRAVDNNTAYPFDPTKLEEYMPTVKLVESNPAPTSK